MEQTENKRFRARRTQEQIKQLMDEFESGDKKISKFCELHRISNTTFHHWQAKYNKTWKAKTNATGFAKLKIHAPAFNPAGVLFAEVHGIKFYQPVAASYLKELVL